jgi:hypothetical protein
MKAGQEIPSFSVSLFIKRPRQKKKKTGNVLTHSALGLQHCAWHLLQQDGIGENVLGHFDKVIYKSEVSR